MITTTFIDLLWTRMQMKQEGIALTSFNLPLNSQNKEQANKMYPYLI